jgi:hypothetical protein
MYSPHVAQQLQLRPAQLGAQATGTKMPVPRRQDNWLIGFYHVTLSPDAQLLRGYDWSFLCWFPLQRNLLFEHDALLVFRDRAPAGGRSPALLAFISQMQARFDQAGLRLSGPLFQPGGVYLVPGSAGFVKQLPERLFNGDVWQVSVVAFRVGGLPGGQR